jgi:hypothetical protein
MANELFVPTPDPLRRGETRARAWWGVRRLAVPAMLALLTELFAPGVGLWGLVAVGLVATVQMLLAHGAAARDRAAAAILRTAARAAAVLAASLGALTACAARRRIPPPPALPAAGLILTPRLAPTPVAARA